MGVSETLSNSGYVEITDKFPELVINREIVVIFAGKFRCTMCLVSTRSCSSKMATFETWIWRSFFHMRLCVRSLPFTSADFWLYRFSTQNPPKARYSGNVQYDFPESLKTSQVTRLALVTFLWCFMAQRIGDTLPGPNMSHRPTRKIRKSRANAALLRPVCGKLCLHKSGRIFICRTGGSKFIYVNQGIILKCVKKTRPLYVV